MNTTILGFVTFCVGALAVSMNLPRNKVYAMLKQGDLIDDYIVPLYDVLHTFSRQYIIDDLKEMLKLRGVI